MWKADALSIGGKLKFVALCAGSAEPKLVSHRSVGLASPTNRASNFPSGRPHTACWRLDRRCEDFIPLHS
jgi:hypothetical protein